MTTYVLLVLLLFFVQTLLPSSLRYMGHSDPRAVMRIALGPRDDPPPMPLHGQRAARALANLQEALPVFLTLALLHLVTHTTSPSAVNGAAIFFFARVLYVPAYLSGVSGVRSAIWGLGVVGLLMMAWPLIP